MPEHDGLIYGLTDEGFYAPTFLECRGWVIRQFQKVFGQNLRTEPKTVAGRIIDVPARLMNIGFQAAEGAFNAAFYSTAPGVSLDKWMEAYSFGRLDDAPSKAELVVWGTNGTVIEAGRQAQLEDGPDVFGTDAEVTIGLKVIVADLVQLGNDGDSWNLNVNGDGYSYAQQPGDTLALVASGLAGEIGAQPDYTATTVKTTTGHAVLLDSNGPDLNASLIPPAAGDGTDYPAARVASTCTVDGPVNGFASTINIIATPKTGWTGVVNPLDAVVGRDTETDEEYRSRWDRERFGPGKATQPAMKSAFLRTPELRELVKSVIVTEVPGEYFTVTLYAPDLPNDVAAQIIWDNKPLGALPNGSEVGVAVDSQNDEVKVHFERAAALWVWMKIVVTKGEGFPVLGDPSSAIAQEIKIWGDGGESLQVPGLAYSGLPMGGDLVRFQVATAINNAVRGVSNAVIRIATTELQNAPVPDDNLFVDADLEVDDLTFLEFESSKIFISFN